MIVSDREDVDDFVAQQLDEVVREAGYGKPAHEKITGQFWHRRAAVRPRPRMLDGTVDRSKELQAEPSAAVVVPDGGSLKLSRCIGVKHRPPGH